VISLQKINTKILSRQRGVSMIELIVAMALGLFLLFALIEILINGKQSFGAANNLSRLQENGRIAINLLASDLKRTGYMGGNSDVPKISGTTPPQAPNAGCPTATTNWGLMITQPIFGLDDTRTGYDCIPATAYLRGDILVVRHAAPWVETGALLGTRTYLRSSLFDGKTFLGSAQADVTNNVPNTPNSVREMLAHAYFVGPSGRSCGSAAVPSLFRVRLGDNGRPVSEELLPGIEHFQVQYGINDQYLDADKIALADWPNVVTARIWLLVRSECAESGYADGATYTMGDINYTPNDSFRRQLYSSVVMIRNQI
jgi:type IV pilus assembly protein PilW